MAAYRTTAINALRSYQESSLIPSVDSLVSWLDSRYGSAWLDLWGKAVSNVDQSKLKNELRMLAKVKGMSFPSRPELNDVIFKVGGTIDSAKILKEVAVETLDYSHSLFRNLLFVGIGLAALGVILSSRSAGKGIGEGFKEIGKGFNNALSGLKNARK